MLTGASRLTRARSISNTSANTQTESSSPTVNSSTAVPPEYCPCTSAPGFTLRAMTSPSIGARSVNSCETASAAPLAKQARLRLRALHLGLGLPVVVLGRLEVALRAGVRIVELLLAAKVMLRGDQIGLGLAEVGEGVADVGRFDGRQRGPPSSSARPGRPGCASPGPVTGEKMCATRRSSNETLPLVTISLPTPCSATGSTWTLASRTCCDVSQTSPSGGCAGVLVAAGALRQPVDGAATAALNISGQARPRPRRERVIAPPPSRWRIRSGRWRSSRRSDPGCTRP